MLAAGGLLCKYFGWKSLFYVPGVLAAAWILVWNLVVSDNPEEQISCTCNCIPQKEKSYFIQNLKTPSWPCEQAENALMDGELEEMEKESYLNTTFQQRIQEGKEKLKFPVLAVLKSPCVWAIWFCNICFDYGTTTFFTSISTFMKQVLYFDIEKNGLLSALPYLLMWVMIVGSGFLVDSVLFKYTRLSIGSTRKLFSGIGMIAPGIIIIFLWFIDCTRPALAVIIFTLGIALTGLNFSGYVVSYTDVSPNYAGIIGGIGNTVSCALRYWASFLPGLITNSNIHTASSWAIPFTITGTVLILGGVVFVLFSSEERQWWDKDKEDENEWQDVVITQPLQPEQDEFNKKNLT